MNNLYNTTKTRCAGLLSAIALMTVCGTTASAQTAFGPFSASPVLAITDDGYNGTLGSMGSSTIAVSGVAGTSVVGISVDLQIAHTWPGDLVVKLVSPDNDVLTLFSRSGYAETIDDGTGCCGLSSDLTTEVLTFSDAGVTDGELMTAPFSSTYFPSPGITSYPTQTFASLYGGTMNGAWTLYIGDAGGGDVGTLNSWGITITTASPSIISAKFVAVEDGNGDCTDDVFPANPVSVLGVEAGTNVCYFYYGENNGDVPFSTHDLVDDQLGAILLGTPFLLNPASAVYVSAMANITAEVTNVADWTAYNAGPTDVVTSQATATVGIIPSNDECANAEMIACGDVVAGTNLGATEQSVPAFGGGTVGAGVWYVFTGTGNDVTLSTCNDATFDTEINIVTTTDCINFTNVAGNDDGSGCAGNTSQVTFTSVASQTYYVYVSDWVSGGGNAGTFNLTMTCVAPANDLCSNAQVIACGDVVAGSNLGATEQAVTTSNGFTVGTGVWYVFTGTGGDVVVSTCGAADFDTEINVITTADCMDYTNNVAGNDDGTGCGLTSEVTFTTVAAQTYYVYVSDWNSGGGNEGTFNLSLTCVAPANDLCANATVISCGDVVAGTNIGATEQSIPTSNGGTVGAGVWYTFTGTGGDVTLSTCGDADFDSEINVVTSADCMNFTNVAGNDDATGCGLTSEVTFTSVASQTYYVYVSDYASGGSEIGTFNLTLTCDPVTGISHALENGISVYPNPSNGQFVVEVNGVDADAQIIVMDIAGRQVYTEGVTMNGSFRKELNLNVATGTYLLQIATVDGTVTRKIQIN